MNFNSKSSISLRRPPAPSVPRKPLKLRQTYTLTESERERFAMVCGARWPMSGFAFKFWQDVAISRGLDPETVIGSTTDPASFSALPWGHGKHWCWPMPLKCGKPPTLFPHLHVVAE